MYRLLTYMWPTFLIDDPTNHRLADRIKPAYIGLALALCVQFSNFPHIQFCDFGCWISFASNYFWMIVYEMGVAVGVAILGHLVIRIILAGSEKQMVRIATRRVVAAMANIKLSRVYSIPIGICKPVGHELASIVGPPNAIPAWPLCCRPLPTLFESTNFNFRPKPIRLDYSQGRQWFTIIVSHLISFQDLWSEPRNVLIHLRGSFYFNAISLEAI